MMIPVAPGVSAIGAGAILIGAYVLIVFEMVNRAVVALLGACLLVGLGVLSQQQALTAIDFNTLGLLAGMMIIVSVASRSGLFSFLAIRTAQLVGASPAGILAAFAGVTALLSAFVNNVTIVSLTVPVTFIICSELKLSVYPFLVTEIFSSNIGGTATLIGDPPNVLIGSATGLTFDAFAANLAPVVCALLLLQILVCHAVWGRRLLATAEDRRRVMSIKAHEAIEDRYLLICSVSIILGVVAALIFATALHLEPATIAVFGAALLLLLQTLPKTRRQHSEIVGVALTDVDWMTLMFLMGLFVMVGGIAHAGVLKTLGGLLLSAAGRNVHLTTTLILWLSAALSSVVDNVPYVAAMIPLIKGIAPELGTPQTMAPLWWSLALGAGLGGNGTLIGASANLTVAALAERNGVRFSFVDFAVAAMPLMLATVAVANLYLAWRFG
jgi:Na+/H+ antiporter NhaD/arsenite permease-like protein